MKLKFKDQQFQIDATAAVAMCSSRPQFAAKDGRDLV